MSSRGPLRAERDRRATILTAEGVKQSQVLTAEGEKQAAVLRAEGEAQSRILRAEGESRAILQVFDAIHEGDADPKLLAYQYLQMLPGIANGTASKLWVVPTPNAVSNRVVLGPTRRCRNVEGLFADGRFDRLVSERSLSYSRRVTERLGRARPMSREERRTAIVEATIPLLIEHGLAVTTRQIAGAAGVAEGTLFRVFADKDEILRTAVADVLDPEVVAVDLRAIPADLPLTETVTSLATVLTERQRTAMQLMGAAHHLVKAHHGHDRDAQGSGAGSSHREIRSREMQRLLDVVAEILAVHRNKLRLAPHQVARILFSIVMGNSMPIVGDEGSLEIPEIVDVVLRGIGLPALADAGSLGRQPAAQF